ncbi:MAG: arsinothricin resistance N-acetyltransferase ArsN1 family B [Telluria sp.]
MIRDAETRDAEAVSAIYRHYVLTTTISFEEVPPSVEEMGCRIQAVQDGKLPWLVAEIDGRVVGYAYATKWKERSAYRFSVETSVYLDAAVHGRGVASALYERLLEALRAAGIHTVIGGIAQPNPASVRLHEKFGFEQVGLFRQVGRKFDRWVDVGYWQRPL